ncbi:uncharacterized protein LOC127045341 isoform X2 [Gopherus flavomarginatus]|uniref:uncharacterized protein LOC127045341 isoform X2 n=1 Tax=Gopherus flavomarginatus TaxID=286002 RepID=UPI0021CBF788|nr:uncharacterized protein LOC127045341 isoform X2 [Gopherus flavomarginatus]
MGSRGHQSRAVRTGPCWLPQAGRKHLQIPQRPIQRNTTTQGKTIGWGSLARSDRKSCICSHQDARKRNNLTGCPQSLSPPQKYKRTSASISAHDRRCSSNEQVFNISFFLIIQCVAPCLIYCTPFTPYAEHMDQPLKRNETHTLPVSSS